MSNSDKKSPLEQYKSVTYPILSKRIDLEAQIHKMDTFVDDTIFNLIGHVGKEKSKFKADFMKDMITDANKQIMNIQKLGDSIAKNNGNRSVLLQLSQLMKDYRTFLNDVNSDKKKNNFPLEMYMNVYLKLDENAFYLLIKKKPIYDVQVTSNGVGFDKITKMLNNNKK